MGSCVVAKNPLNNLPLERTSPAAFQPPTDTNVPARSQPSNNIYRQATNT